jgi:type I restriction enzyme S subunit
MDEVALGELCSLIVDSEHKTAPKDPAGSHPLIRTSDLGKACADLSRVQRVSSETHALWTKRAVPIAGDLILAREAPVGGIFRVPDGVEPVLGQRTVLLRPDPCRVDGGFLMYRLASGDSQGRMFEMSTGATVPHLNMADIRTFPLPPLPTISMQRRIAAVLSAFDELIEINERRIGLLEDLARSLYREWFVRFRFPGHEEVELVDSELGPVPEGWEVQPLRDVAALRYGKSLPASTRRPGSVPVVSSAGIIDTHDYALVEGPGIVIGRKGNVGAVWWVQGDFFPIDTTYYVESALSLGFLYWQLRDLEFIDSHAAVPGLARAQATALPLVIPARQLVGHFDRVHQSLFVAMAGLRAAIDQLTATRDLLLPRLVTGRLDISDVDLGVLTPTEAG